MIRQYLRKKNILVNNKIMIYPNHILPYFDFLSFNPVKREKLHAKLRKRFRRKHMFYKTPFYLEVNNRIFTCLVIQTFVNRNT